MLWIFIFTGLFLRVVQNGATENLYMRNDTKKHLAYPIYLFSTPHSENLPSIRVEDSNGAHIFEEGQSVTLVCEANYSASWTWERLKQNGAWQEVATGEKLVLSTVKESGEYRCLGYSYKSYRNKTQEMSLAYPVYFFAIPHSGNSVVGLAAAALVLSLLNLILLTVLVLWLFVSWVKERSSPNTRTVNQNNYISESTPHPPADDGDIYMNSLEIEKAYTELNPTFMSENQNYATID